jgi:hypothetical protein
VKFGRNSVSAMDAGNRSVLPTFGRRSDLSQPRLAPRYKVDLISPISRALVLTFACTTRLPVMAGCIRDARHPRIRFSSSAR